MGPIENENRKHPVLTKHGRLFREKGEKEKKRKDTEHIGVIPIGSSNIPQVFDIYFSS